MYERLLSLWTSGVLSEQGLGNAVKKNWITEEQKAKILATPQSDA